MSWAMPWLLMLIPFVAGLAAMRWWWGRALLRAVAGSGAGYPDHAISVGRRRSRLRATLLWSGLLLAVISLIGPRWGGENRERAARGADIIVTFDCSRSMLATDLSPSRLEVARRKCIDLLRIAPHLRLGLMPFAATPVLRCPPTGDQQTLTELLLDCTPDLFPAEANLQGTAIGLAVQESLGVLARSHEPGQAVLVVSDGADDDTDAVKKAAQAAKDAGVPVFGLFVGDTSRSTDLVIDGVTQKMTADTGTLDQLTTATGALWVGATLDDRDMRTLAEAIDRTAGHRDWEEQRRTVSAERFRWALLPAIVLIAAGMLLGTRRRVA